MRQRLWFCWSVPIVWSSGSGSRTWNASVQQSGGGDLWLVKLSPLAVSVEAGEKGQHQRATVARDDRDPAIECLANDDRVGVTSKCHCRSTFSSHSPPRGPRAFATPAPGQQSGTTSAQPYDGEIRRHARERGSHDGLYAARVYRQDRRRLLRRLRRSSGCSPVRSCRISGFGGCTRPCRGAWPNGIASGAGIFPEAEEQQSHHGLYAAKVYRNDRRRLLRRLR